MAASEYATIYIVRHGETDWNVKNIVQGQSDSVLNEKGKKQAKSVSEKFKDATFDVIFSSDLSRAKQTAEIINMEHKLVVNTTKLLREKFLGKYEGGSRKIYEEENKAILEKLEKLTEEENRKFKISDEVESDEEVLVRFITILREIAVTYPGKTILVVTHNGMMRALLIHLGWASYDDLPWEGIENGAHIKLESNGVEFIIKEAEGINKINKK